MTASPSVLPLQLGGGGYQISRSVRLRSSASAYFNRTPASSSSANIWTWSAWVKRGSLGSTQVLLCARDYTNSANSYPFASIQFDSSDALSYNESYNGVYIGQKITTQVFRDPSAWYHFVVALDTTQVTASNRVKLYVNGVQITNFSTSVNPSGYTSIISSNKLHYLGANISAPTSTPNFFFDGYLAEVNFVSGLQLTPSSFGTTDSNGIWQPKAYTGTYGTNGFYLKFTDNSAATAAAIGKDYSGNGNNWTPNNISVTAGTTYDSMIDSPTVGSGASNYPVINPLKVGGTASLLIYNANLRFANTNATWINSRSSIQPKIGGKYYLEFTSSQNWTANNVSYIGLCTPDMSLTSNAADIANIYTTTTSGEVLALAIDRVSNQVTTYRNNTLVATTSISSTADIDIAIASYAASGDINFGQRPFTYTPPSGFAALNTYNLPPATINNGATVMAASTYTGTGATQSIVNSGNNAAGRSFQPDLVWIKSRSAATDHKLTDSVRGATKALIANTNGAETTDATGLTAFGSSGFSLGADANYNTNAATYVGWQWQAGQGTTSSNTNGSITSTVSVNQSAGFSVVTYTGTGANATVGHGLGVAPKMVFVKKRTGTIGVTLSDFTVWHTGLTSGAYYLFLDATASQASAPTIWNSTIPTSTVFSIGTNTLTNESTGTFVAYCWSEVAGYSKFGSYTGNGSADGPFCYTGFQPRWVMIKRTDAGPSNWTIQDTSRDPYNVSQSVLYPNVSNAETTANQMDFLSNGFKLRTSGTENNGSGATYIYAAFAANPFNISRGR